MNSKILGRFRFFAGRDADANDGWLVGAFFYTKSGPVAYDVIIGIAAAAGLYATGIEFIEKIAKPYSTGSGASDKDQSSK